MYRYAPLDAKTGGIFAPLTYERYHAALNNPLAGFIAIGAYQLWQPVGLVVCFYDGKTQQAQIVSLTVVPKHQNKGIGTELLRQFEQVVCEQGCRSMKAVYVGDNPPLERIFLKHHWEMPKIIGVAVECNYDRIEPSPIYQIKPALPSGFEVFPWDELTVEERVTIEVREAQPGGWYSASEMSGSVSPFSDERFRESHCSIGLRYQGEVVGWMIVHRTREDALHFISLFVSPEHRQQNLGIFLVMLAIQRGRDYYQQNVPDIRVFWQFRIENKVMEQMVEAHLAPYAIDFKREKSAQKLCI